MMHETTIGNWTVCAAAGALPSHYADWRTHAALSDEIDLKSAEGAVSVLAVREAGASWPALVIAQRYAPHEAGFYPGCLIVPETERLFVGAGTRLLAYDLGSPKRLWADETECGFHAWHLHQDIVLMAAETECAAWNLAGRKLWSVFADPPWDFRARGAVIEIADCAGRRRMQLTDGQTIG